METMEVLSTFQVPDGPRADALRSERSLGRTVEFRREFSIPSDLGDWQIGVVVGPSGSGKTSLGRRMWGGGHLWTPGEWHPDKPLIDDIRPDLTFDDVTGALATVGLGTVPSWLRPYHVLSNGEQFRAGLARLVAEAPQKAVLDEFSSVVDRQIACIGAFAFSRAWRRTSGQVVLLTPHYDILEWMDPDWVLDTGTGRFSYTRGEYIRPQIHLEIRQTGWKYWPIFKPHHYLMGAGPMAYSTAFVGFVNGEPVAHMGMTGHYIGQNRREARACRMVVMPEWQGAGISLRFMNFLCQREMDGNGFIGAPVSTIFHTAHPALCKVLRRDDQWRQISGELVGSTDGLMGFGRHFRVVQGFRYFGARGTAQARERRERQQLMAAVAV